MTTPIDRLPSNRSGRNPTATTKHNYTAIVYGNEYGSVGFGHIHEKGDVTTGVRLSTPDAEHHVVLDVDGPRKGYTQIAGPGNFSVNCGSANTEAAETLSMVAENGNISITATNGKIRLQATDIELVAVGEGGSKGNIRLKATETLETVSKKTLMTSTAFFRIATPGTGEVVANSVLQMYGSVFRGISDGCILKNSKVGGQRYALAQIALTTAQAVAQ